MNLITLLSIPLAYLLGAIPSAYIIGRWVGKIDIRDEGDGKISAAAIERRVGRKAFLFVVIMDIGKAALAVLLAQFAFRASTDIVLVNGIFAIAGHQWSPFLRWKGGLGATTIGGVLVGVVSLPTIIGAACAALLWVTTKKSTFSFFTGVFIIFVIVFALQYSNIKPPPVFLEYPSPPFLIVYPLILAAMMLLKALQIKFLRINTIRVK